MVDATYLWKIDVQKDATNTARHGIETTTRWHTTALGRGGQRATGRPAAARRAAAAMATAAPTVVLMAFTTSFVNHATLPW